MRRIRVVCVAAIVHKLTPTMPWTLTSTVMPKDAIGVETLRKGPVARARAPDAPPRGHTVVSPARAPDAPP